MKLDRTPSIVVVEPREARGTREHLMLWDAYKVKGYTIQGSDGPLGTVSDLLIDDSVWRLRWLVANTRYWLPRHEVLLPASCLHGVDPGRRQLCVTLTMDQIQASPGIDLDPPISRQAEIVSRSHCDPDLHLRSVEAIVGHRVYAADEMIGHVDDLLIDDVDWSICYVKVDTRNWHLGDSMLLPPRSLREIDWRGRMIRLEIDRRQIETSQTCAEAPVSDTTQLPHCGIKWTRT